jgi:DNA-binding CsgD family transcriptional regulator
MLGESAEGEDVLEVAEALGIAERTVRRDWERAKMLLSVSLKR